MTNNLPNELVAIILDKLNFYSLLRISDNTRENINNKNIYEILKYCKSIVLMSLTIGHSTKIQDIQNAMLNKLIIDDDENTDILMQKSRIKLAIKKDDTNPEWDWDLRYTGLNTKKEYIESYNREWVENLSMKRYIKDLTIIDSSSEKQTRKIDELLLFTFSHANPGLTLLLNDHLFSCNFDIFEYGKIWFKNNGNTLYIRLMYLIPGTLALFPSFKENSPIIAVLYDSMYEKSEEKQVWERIYNCESLHTYKNTLDFNACIYSLFHNDTRYFYQEWIVGNFGISLTPKIQYISNPYILSEIKHFREKTIQIPEFSKIDFIQNILEIKEIK
jgi:hypothetical protein